MSSEDDLSKQLHRDREGAEAAHLMNAAHLQGKRLLEIGCGDGFLTWQLAGIPRKYVALDPHGERLAQAQARRTVNPSPVAFTQSRAERLPFPPGSFDVAVFAHSL